MSNIENDRRFRKVMIVVGVILVLGFFVGWYQGNQMAVEKAAAKKVETVPRKTHMDWHEAMEVRISEGKK